MNVLKKISRPLFILSIIFSLSVFLLTGGEAGGYYSYIFYPLIGLTVLIFGIIFYYRGGKFDISLPLVLISAELLVFFFFGGGVLQITYRFVGQITNNLSVCRKADSPHACIQGALSKDATSKDCLVLKTEWGNEFVDICYRELAIEKNDAATCEFITTPESRELCYVNLATLKADEALCYKVPAGKKECLSKVSILNETIDTCLLINDTKCLMFFAVKNNDLALCNKIKDPIFHEDEACKNNVSLASDKKYREEVLREAKRMAKAQY